MNDGAGDTQQKGGHSTLYLVVVALFIATLIASNIVAVKLINVSGLTLTAAIVIFPLSYIIGDILTEVYGYRQARRAIWLGFLANLLVVVTIVIAGALPAAGFWKDQLAFDLILGQSPRILAASFAAYLVGEFANSFVLAKMKIATAGRFLWLRTIGSTLVGQGLDSAIFVAIAFAGVLPGDVLVATMITQWLVKSGYEAAATPLTYLTVGYLKHKDGVDVYDHDTRFNPLLIAD
jgi:uncharacterized integral membrane protein (TIGR00697 family)